MSSVHCIVVWEYQQNGQWLPHTPGVARTLERAHAKKLTRVVLADADPALKGHYVNLRTLTQCIDTPEGGGGAECPVRRQCYSVQSCAGRGARWEWARLTAPHDFEPMPMEVQCAVEEAWARGAEGARAGGWRVWAARGEARRGRCVRRVRRAPQPPYPLARAPAPPPPEPPLRHNTIRVVAPHPRIPQQHTGSSVHSVQSTVSNLSSHSNHSDHSNLSNHSNHSNLSNHSNQSSQAGGARAGARSASPRDRKPGLARQILHNLNIFSHNNKQVAGPQVDRERDGKQASEGEEQRTDTESSSTRSGRRHSVDTVSTYLSHESKDSLQRGSVGELLNCSGGSDDVFEPSRDCAPALQDLTDAECEEEAGLPAWARAVSQPQWGALCPECLRALGGAERAVALRPCHHLLHARCLRAKLQEAGYVECLVCGHVYGSPAPPAPPAPLAATQPPGSMAWRLQHTPLPQLDTCTSILVTYNFQSGVQGAGQPAPGAPYYAVGFPRHSVLPEGALGRQVLAALRAAWERRVLFTVGRSQTTGREHVVAWRVAPPPPDAAAYAAGCPRRLLLAALARLHKLLAAPL